MIDKYKIRAGARVLINGKYPLAAGSRRLQELEFKNEPGTVQQDDFGELVIVLDNPEISTPHIFIGAGNRKAGWGGLWRIAEEITDPLDNRRLQ